MVLTPDLLLPSRPDLRPSGNSLVTQACSPSIGPHRNSAADDQVTRCGVS